VTATQFVAAVVRTEVIAALLIVLGLVQFGISEPALATISRRGSRGSRRVMH
jgi:hypothetical protein